MKYLRQVIAICIIILIVLVSCIFLSKSIGKDNWLYVNEMYLMKTGEDERNINISALLYITNTNAKSGDVKIIIFIMKQWRVVVDKLEVEVGKLEKDKTSEIQFEFQLDNINQSYKMDILVFEDELLGITADGRIRVSSTGDVYWESPPDFAYVM
ncbi:hypothetical protein B6U81_02900 [Thermoplasmatales archaeon ex4484_30]|nr:MAG: hypothetical protein B6U81_02900 [Thermoplasmatales archaeon ex4484_30]